MYMASCSFTYRVVWPKRAIGSSFPVLTTLFHTLADDDKCKDNRNMNNKVVTRSIGFLAIIDEEEAVKFT